MSGPRAQFGGRAAVGPPPAHHPTPAEAVVLRRTSARVGRGMPLPAALPVGRTAAAARVFAPAQRSARRRVSAGGRGFRGPVAVPVLAVAVVALTWMDTGVLRTDARAQDLADPARGTAQDGDRLSAGALRLLPEPRAARWSAPTATTDPITPDRMSTRKLLVQPVMMSRAADPIPSGGISTDIAPTGAEARPDGNFDFDGDQDARGVPTP